MLVDALGKRTGGFGSGSGPREGSGSTFEAQPTTRVYTILIRIIGRLVLAFTVITINVTIILDGGREQIVTIGTFVENRILWFRFDFQRLWSLTTVFAFIIRGRILFLVILLYDITDSGPSVD